MLRLVFYNDTRITLLLSGFKACQKEMNNLLVYKERKKIQRRITPLKQRQDFPDEQSSACSDDIPHHGH